MVTIVYCIIYDCFTLKRRCHANQTRFSQTRANQTRPPRRGFSATRSNETRAYRTRIGLSSLWLSVGSHEGVETD